MEIERFINSPVSSNCYILEEKGHAVVIDPGTYGSKEILTTIDERHLLVDDIILTHEHFDHCAGTESLRRCTKAPLLCTSICNELIQDARKNYSAYWTEGEPFSIHPADRTVGDGDILQWQGHTFYFYHTPGHSLACLTIRVDETALFTGDNFIPQMRTYTNLNGGSKDDLRRTLVRLHSLKQFTHLIVYPGHNDSIPIGDAHFNEAFRGFSAQQLKNCVL